LWYSGIVYNVESLVLVCVYYVTPW